MNLLPRAKGSVCHGEENTPDKKCFEHPDSHFHMYCPSCGGTWLMATKETYKKNWSWIYRARFAPLLALKRLLVALFGEG